MKKNVKKHIQSLKNKLDKLNVYYDDGMNWKEGVERNWCKENTIIIYGWDCRYLVNVGDKKGRVSIDYFDLFMKGEYSYMLEKKIRKSRIEYYGTTNSIKELFEQINVFR